jgi:hypothetical protein
MIELVKIGGKGYAFLIVKFQAVNAERTRKI